MNSGARYATIGLDVCSMKDRAGDKAEVGSE